METHSHNAQICNIMVHKWNKCTLHYYPDYNLKIGKCFIERNNNLSFVNFLTAQLKELLFRKIFLFFLMMKMVPKLLLVFPENSREASWMCVVLCLCVLCVSGGVKIRVGPCKACNYHGQDSSKSPLCRKALHSTALFVVEVQKQDS